MSTLDLPTLSLAVGRARMVSYFNVASSVILIYDWFLTIPLEVATIWRSKWSLTKVLFITTRYIAYLQLVDIVYYYPRSPTSAPKVCQITYEIHTWSVAIGVGAGEALLSLRTWAVWGSSRKMGLFLGVLWIITWSSAFALVVMFLQKIQYGVTPLTSYVVCYATARSTTAIFWSWVIFLLWNTLMLVLMAIPAYRTFQELGRDRTLTKIVYQDGLIYYSYLFVISLINIIVILNTPPDLVTLLSTMERALHAVLTCRAILHIRAQGLGLKAGTQDRTRSSGGMRFREVTRVSMGSFAR